MAAARVIGLFIWVFNAAVSAAEVDKSPVDDCKCWAGQGNCDSNAGFMLDSCAGSCARQKSWADCEVNLQASTKLAASATDLQKQIDKQKQDLEKERSEKSGQTKAAQELQKTIDKQKAELEAKQKDVLRAVELDKQIEVLKKDSVAAADLQKRLDTQQAELETHKKSSAKVAELEKQLADQKKEAGSAAKVQQEFDAHRKTSEDALKAQKAELEGHKKEALRAAELEKQLEVHKQASAADLGKLADAHKKAMDDLQKQLETQKSALVEREKQMEDHTVEAAKASELQKQVDLARKDSEDKLKANDDLQKQLNTLMDANGKQSLRVAELEKSEISGKAELDQLVRSKKDIDDKLTAMTAEHTKQKNLASDLNKQLEASAGDKEKGAGQAAEFQKQLEAQKEEAAEKLKAKVAECDGSSETQKKAADDLHKQLQEQQKELETHKSGALKAADLDKQVEAHKKEASRVPDLQKELDAQKKAAEEMKAKAAECDGSSETHKKVADDLRKQLQEQQRELETHKSGASEAADLDKLVEANKKEASRVADLQKELDAQKKAAEEMMNAKVAECDGSSETQKKAADDLRKQLQQQQKELETYKSGALKAADLDKQVEAHKKEASRAADLQKELDAQKKAAEEMMKAKVAECDGSSEIQKKAADDLRKQFQEQQKELETHKSGALKAADLDKQVEAHKKEASRAADLQNELDAQKKAAEEMMKAKVEECNGSSETQTKLAEDLRKQLQEQQQELETHKNGALKAADLDKQVEAHKKEASRAADLQKELDAQTKTAEETSKAQLGEHAKVLEVQKKATEDLQAQLDAKKKELENHRQDAQQAAGATEAHEKEVARAAELQARLDALQTEQKVQEAELETCKKESSRVALLDEQVKVQTKECGDRAAKLQVQLDAQKSEADSRAEEHSIALENAKAEKEAFQKARDDDNGKAQEECAASSQEQVKAGKEADAIGSKWLAGFNGVIAAVQRGDFLASVKRGFFKDVETLRTKVEAFREKRGGEVEAIWERAKQSRDRGFNLVREKAMPHLDKWQDKLMEGSNRSRTLLEEKVVPVVGRARTLAEMKAAELRTLTAKKYEVALEKAQPVIKKAQPVIRSIRLHVEAMALATFTVSYPASVGLLAWLVAVIFVFSGYVMLAFLQIPLRFALSVLPVFFKITVIALRLSFLMVRFLTAPLRCLLRACWRISRGFCSCLCGCFRRRSQLASQPDFFADDDAPTGPPEPMSFFIGEDEDEADASPAGFSKIEAPTTQSSKRLEPPPPVFAPPPALAPTQGLPAGNPGPPPAVPIVELQESPPPSAESTFVQRAVSGFEAKKASTSAPSKFNEAAQRKSSSIPGNDAARLEAKMDRMEETLENFMAKLTQALDLDGSDGRKRNLGGV